MRRVERTWVIEHHDPDPIGAIEAIVESRGRSAQSRDGGWAIMLSYELGGVIEPKAASGHVSASGFPAAVVQRWTLDDRASAEVASGSFALGVLRSSMGREGYMDVVERTKAYIAAGDIYQANIAHHLSGDFSGSAAACFAALAESARPRYGAMISFAHRGNRHCVCSISPELFLEYDPGTRLVRTQPMKGTRSQGGGNEAALRESPKDRAELDMITDLMRNDLGRVCALGSVRVLDPRRIEPHGSGVLQASSIIEGRMREGAGLGAMLRACFPPGSVTGAPKVRAMQIIAELEGRARDPYCGSLLMLEDSGALRASVAIRTAHIWGKPGPQSADHVLDGRFVYPVGAGLVADSDPAEEWGETLTKAGVLGVALGANLDPKG